MSSPGRPGAGWPFTGLRPRGQHRPAASQTRLRHHRLPLRPEPEPDTTAPRFRDVAAEAGLTVPHFNAADGHSASSRRWAAASACSTTTATAGSTSTASRGARSRRDPAQRRYGRPPLPQPGRRHVRGRHRVGRASAFPGLRPRRRRRRLTTTTATPTSSSPAGGVRPLPQPGRRHVRGRDRGGRASAATATGRPRRPSPTSTATATSTSTSATTCDLGRRADPTVCLQRHARRTWATVRPWRFAAEPDHLFRNDGGGGSPTSAGRRGSRPRRPGARASSPPTSTTTAGSTSSSPTTCRPTILFRNLGGFRFEEVGRRPGRGRQRPGDLQAGMGVACGDLDGDGRPDLAVTNFYGESTTFYRNLGRGLFVIETARRRPGGARAGRLLGFGIAFLDADNDGRLDLVVGQRPRQRLPADGSPTRCPPSSFAGVGRGAARRRLRRGRARTSRSEWLGRGAGRRRPRQRRRHRHRGHPPGPSTRRPDQRDEPARPFPGAGA